MAYPGPIDVVYDTVGKPETFEVGVRVLASRGTLVKAGVHAPGPHAAGNLGDAIPRLLTNVGFDCAEVGSRRHRLIGRLTFYRAIRPA